MLIPKEVTIKEFEVVGDSLYLEIGGTYEVIKPIHDEQLKLVGYEVSTPRNRYAVSLTQIVEA